MSVRTTVLHNVTQDSPTCNKLPLSPDSQLSTDLMLFVAREGRIIHKTKML